MTVRIFKTAALFRRWLETNHANATECHIGHYRKTSGKIAMTYAQAVDEALCFGWIDGVIKKIDDEIYAHRWTPRKRGSIWSLVNIKHVERLLAAGHMAPAGIAAFEARTAARSGVYSFEQKEPATFSAGQTGLFKANKAAWAFWERQPLGYKQVSTFYVTSAKRKDTRERRLALLISDSANGVRLGEVIGKNRER